MCSMYVELHAHSAFSFLDGASLPDELAAAAAELGYEAMALTDHNGVSGSMEFAQAAAPLGVRAIHGAELDLADGRHVTVLVESERGWRNLCHILTRAHAHTRGAVDETEEDRAARQARRGRHQSLVGTRMRRVDVTPETSLATLSEHAAGLVCLSGCAGHGVHDEEGLRRLVAIFGRDRLWVEVQRPFQRDDRARNRALAELAARLGLPTVATGNAHAHARERAPLAGRLHRSAPPHDARRLGARAPRQLLARAGLPAGDGRPLSRASGGGGGERAARRAAAVRPAGRPRVPLPGSGGRRGAEQAGRAVLGEAGRALSGGRRAHGCGPRPARAGAAGDRLARPGRLLHPAPRSARAGARRGGRGARPVVGARAAPSGAGERLLCLLDRLLPHRPLAHRPDHERALPRALPERGPHRAAGHRSRLPARHPRGADPARARALRAREVGARGRVPDVPLARGDPGAGQGARPASRGARAGGARGGAVRRARRGGGRRDRAGAGVRRAAAAAQRPRQPGTVRDVDRGVAGDGQRSKSARSSRRRREPPEPPRRATRPCRAAGAGSRGCATRPTGSRGISPSTRVG